MLTAKPAPTSSAASSSAPKVRIKKVIPKVKVSSAKRNDKEATPSTTPDILKEQPSYDRSNVLLQARPPSEQSTLRSSPLSFADTEDSEFQVHSVVDTDPAVVLSNIRKRYGLEPEVVSPRLNGVNLAARPPGPPLAVTQEDHNFGMEEAHFQRPDHVDGSRPYDKMYTQSFSTLDYNDVPVSHSPRLGLTASPARRKGDLSPLYSNQARNVSPQHLNHNRDMSFDSSSCTESIRGTESKIPRAQVNFNSPSAPIINETLTDDVTVHSPRDITTHIENLVSKAVHERLFAVTPNQSPISGNVIIKTRSSTPTRTPKYANAATYIETSTACSSTQTNYASKACEIQSTPKSATKSTETLVESHSKSVETNSIVHTDAATFMDPVACTDDAETQCSVAVESRSTDTDAYAPRILNTDLNTFVDLKPKVADDDILEMLYAKCKE
jgi:hypothetical protein